MVSKTHEHLLFITPSAETKMLSETHTHLLFMTPSAEPAEPFVVHDTICRALFKEMQYSRPLQKCQFKKYCN